MEWSVDDDCSFGTRGLMKDINLEALFFSSGPFSEGFTTEERFDEEIDNHPAVDKERIWTRMPDYSGNRIPGVNHLFGLLALPKFAAL